MGEKLSLKWNDYQADSTLTFSNLRAESEFTDVTLVGDDHQHISAHKVVLSSCSEYFKSVLIQNKHSHPMILIENVSFTDLSQILDYVYLGEVQIYQEQLDQFLLLAQRFKIKGLIDNQVNKNENFDPKQEGIEDTDDTNNYEPIKKEGKSKENFRKQSDDLELVNTLAVEEGSSIAEVDKIIDDLMGRNEDGKYICRKCGKIGSTWKHNMKNHIETHLEGISFPCEMCGKIFRSRI